MDLLGELFFTELIQDEEFSGEDLVRVETAGGKFDTLDNLPIRNHHSDGSELHLQVLWQLLSTSVTGVHSNEEAEFRVHADLVTVSEDEEATAMFLRLQDNVDLLGSDGEDRKVDSVELIEATPRTGLSETLVNSSETSEIHLIGAVEDDAVFSKSFSHIFGSFGFTSTGGTSGSATESHTKSLSEGDVTSISKWRNNKTVSATKELVLVLEVDVSNGDGTSSLVVVGFRIEVESSLFEPLEIERSFDVPLGELVEDIALMDVNGNESLVLDSVELREIVNSLFDKRSEQVEETLVGDAHDLLVESSVIQSFFGVLCPDHLDTKKTDLSWVLIDKSDQVKCIGLHDVIGSKSDNGMKGRLLKLKKFSNPFFDISDGHDGLVEGNFFAFSREYSVDSVVILLVELDGSNVFENTEQMRLNGMRVGCLTEDFQKSRIGDEEKSREDESLGFEVTGKRLLTAFELLAQVREKLGHVLVTYAALDDIGHLFCASHNFDPGLVNVRESFSGVRKLLGDITTDEDGLEVDPQVLDDEPGLDDFIRVRELGNPLLDEWLERSVVSV